MDFRLIYCGELKSDGNLKHKQAIRRYFHHQLAELWNQVPLKDCRHWIDFDPPDNETTIVRQIGQFHFVPLINSEVELIAELDIILLRPEPPGCLITQSGDIDNRLKTLFDALRMPQNDDEIPEGDAPGNDETPFFCLLEDDKLITKVAVTTDRFLLPPTGTSEVFLLVHVTVRASRQTIGNIALSS